MSKCTWHFSPHNGYEIGPNDPLLQTISGDPWKSLVRESVQNSLDAALDEDEPVVIKFKSGFFSNDQLDGFFELKDHINACAKYYPNDKNAKEIFPAMSRVFKQLNDKSTHIPYVEVSDFNTKGMKYKSDDTACPFYAFVRAAGVSAKDSGRTGGSFGFGKSAYFKMSPLRTIFVSTLTDGKEYVFEGVSVLCTHKYQYNNKCEETVSHVGFFDNNGGKPVIDPNRIPHVLRRTEAGTSIYILGLHSDNSKEMEREMIMAALQDFWLAIYRGRLTIIINEIIISKDNISDLLANYFTEDLDKRKYGQDYNPRPYYRAIAEYGSNEDVRKITHCLPAVGEVALFLIKIPGATDKVTYMRRPLMKVQAKTTGTHYGVYGLFLCENAHGDEILQKMENPAHNEWKASNWRNVNNKKVGTGNEAENQIRDFILTTITKEYAKGNSPTLEITGLDELLYVPESLLNNVPRSESAQQEEGSPQPQTPREANKLDKSHTSATGSVIITETGSPTTSEVPEKEKRPRGTGHKDHISRRKGAPASPGDSFTNGAVNKDGGSHKTFLPVSFRAFTQKIGEQTYHKLIIYSNKDIAKGEIEIMVAGEVGEEMVPLDFTSHGLCNGNRITDISLKSGRNDFEIRFADALRHSIRLKAYENK